MGYRPNTPEANIRREAKLVVRVAQKRIPDNCETRLLQSLVMKPVDRVNLDDLRQLIINVHETLGDRQYSRPDIYDQLRAIGFKFGPPTNPANRSQI